MQRVVCLWAYYRKNIQNIKMVQMTFYSFHEKMHVSSKSQAPLMQWARLSIFSYILGFSCIMWHYFIVQIQGEAFALGAAFLRWSLFLFCKAVTDKAMDYVNFSPVRHVPYIVFLLLFCTYFLPQCNSTKRYRLGEELLRIPQQKVSLNDFQWSFLLYSLQKQ